MQNLDILISRSSIYYSKNILNKKPAERKPLLQSVLPQIPHLLQETYSRWFERKGSAEFEQLEKHGDALGTLSCLCRQEPNQSRDAPVTAHNYLPGFTVAKPWETITLIRSILPLSENSSKFCRSTFKGQLLNLGQAATRMFSGGFAVSGAATRCHQLLDQRRSEQKMLLLSGHLLLKAMIFTRTTNILRENGHFPLQNQMLFVL